MVPVLLHFHLLRTLLQSFPEQLETTTTFAAPVTVVVHSNNAGIRVTSVSLLAGNLGILKRVFGRGMRVGILFG